MALPHVNIPLPIREGLSPSYVWLPHGPWSTVLAFLVERFPDVSLETWLARMGKEEVVDESGAPIYPSSAYRKGSCIYYYRELEEEAPVPFAERILYCDDHILVADKPHFLPVIPSGRFVRETLLVRLKKQTGLIDLTPIHRIDRETAGIVVFSHCINTRGQYQSLFQKREVSKVYEAVAPTLRHLKFPVVRRSRMVEGLHFFNMCEVDGEPNSETLIDVLETGEHFSLYRLQPVTGKKHQLRVHLAALGAPILNDGFYPNVLPCKGNDYAKPLQLLARSIAFTDPLTGTERYFRSGHSLRARIHSDLPESSACGIMSASECSAAR